MLTLFAVPKPLEGEVELIQRNALGSWRQMGEAVEVLLIGDELGVKQVADEYGFHHIPEVERNSKGTPLVSSAFDQARRHSNNPVLCYINADIILLEGMLSSLQKIQEQFTDFLAVGQRWDLTVKDRLDFSVGWRAELWREVERHGQLHPPAGSDYFLFPKQLFANMPQLALGRSGWDNWMIYAGRHKRVAVVDATGAIRAIHQDHAYAHLDGGLPHYRQPESRENLRLAGGRQTIFTLADATWRFANGRISRVGLPGGSVGRALEAALITRLGTGRQLQVLRVLLHPFEFLHSRAQRDITRIRQANDLGND